MVAQQQDLSLHLEASHVAELFVLGFVQSFQSIHRLRMLFGMHAVHRPATSFPHKETCFQVGHLNLVILQRDPLHQSFPEAPHDTQEVIGLQHIASHWASRSACGRTILGKQEPALAEIVPLVQRSLQLVPNENLYDPGLDSEELLRRISFSNDFLAILVRLQNKRIENARHLILRTSFENEDVLQPSANLILVQGLRDGGALSRSRLMAKSLENLRFGELKYPGSLGGGKGAPGLRFSANNADPRAHGHPGFVNRFAIDDHCECNLASNQPMSGGDLNWVAGQALN
mmetsp:Transcript_52624/g.139786  ORF Transcript_52624/g.139786 Transcript_52624/m.139786 type:complete len:287 (-) Transcript_52624:1383-2243(-)